MGYIMMYAPPKECRLIHLIADVLAHIRLDETHDLLWHGHLHTLAASCRPTTTFAVLEAEEQGHEVVDEIRRLNAELYGLYKGRL